VEIYLINVTLDGLADDEERAYFMRIPTTLYLTDQQIERLPLASARLIRESPEFQRLIRDLKKAAQ
jgi:NTE family protein